MEEFANLVDQYYQELYRFGFSLAKDRPGLGSGAADLCDLGLERPPDLSRSFKD